MTGINQLVYERWRDRPPAEVVEWHRLTHEDAVRALNETPVEWFGRRERAPSWPSDFDGHSAAHRVKDIEAAIASRSPG